jgi:uncharacterized Rmd1/YagE family protein
MKERESGGEMMITHTMLSAFGTGDAEIYMFSYGTVVIWSMTEKRFP